MIPMVDLKGQYLDLKEEIDKGILDALDACQFILGPNVQAFEKEAAEYLGVKHAIGVASGTDALHLGLIAAGVGPGDEVITSAFTFIATAEAIRYVGATPVFVDIDEQTFNIDIAEIEKAITPKTKAVIPVHIFGQPVEMAPLMTLCEKNNLAVVEDCAQSFGAHINGKQTGGFGTVGCFSFFPSKNLGCYGDGGLITTNSDEVAEHVKSLRNHGMKVRYYHDEIGYNSRLDELQAVILRAKLKRMDSYSEGRRRAAHRYSDLMKEMVTVPAEDGIGLHVYHQYTLLSEQRDAILEALQAKQIGCAIYYPVPLHKQNVFKEEYKDVNLPVTDKISATCMSLPIFPELNDEQIDQIVGIISGVVKGAAA